MTQMGIGGLPSANQKEALAQKPPNKLEGVFRTMLEQKSFYPLYPGQLDVPIEWQQVEALGFRAQPDVIFTPSDLKLCAKVSNQSIMFVEYRRHYLCESGQRCQGNAERRQLRPDDRRAALIDGNEHRACRRQAKSM